MTKINVADSEAYNKSKRARIRKLSPPTSPYQNTRTNSDTHEEVNLAAQMRAEISRLKVELALEQSTQSPLIAARFAAEKELAEERAAHAKALQDLQADHVPTDDEKDT